MTVDVFSNARLRMLHSGSPFARREAVGPNLWFPPAAHRSPYPSAPKDGKRLTRLDVLRACSLALLSVYFHTAGDE
jgi:hypothetical protein